MTFAWIEERRTEYPVAVLCRVLGVSRAAQRPVFQDGNFVPRLMLPLSLSYDHRVIDGAAAARFTTFLAQTLGDAPGLLQAVP